MLPLGDIDEDELVIREAGEPAEIGAGDTDIPPAIPGLRRQILLTRMILALRGNDTTPEQAARLAVELGRLLDQVQTEQLGFEALAGLVPEAFAEHWQITLEFLRILSEQWPLVLAAEGCIDAAERRNRLLAAQAESWRRTPPRSPVIAAGSTGSIPATAELLCGGRRVARGLRRAAGARLFSHPGDPPPDRPVASAGGHAGPAGSFRYRNQKQVKDWPAPELRRYRRRTQAHRQHGHAPAGSDAHPGMPPRTAGRIGTRRHHPHRLPVAAGRGRGHCAGPARNPEDAGPERGPSSPMTGPWRGGSPPSSGAGMSRSTIRPASRWPRHRPRPSCCWLRRWRPKDSRRLPTLAALKHPLAACGRSPAACRAEVRRLEIAALRGPRPNPGIGGIRARLGKQADAFAGLLDTIESAAETFRNLTASPSTTLDQLTDALIALAESLAAGDGEDGAARLWAGETGEAVAGFIGELRESAGRLGPIDGRRFPALLEALMAGRVVRPRFGLHPRLHIWGPLEARLQQTDLLILGGLNEGTWPPETHAGPWMSRPMMQSFGLPLPERRIGLAAHDFVQAFCAPRVILTRATRVAGTPTVPSRWLLRLETLLSGAGLAEKFRPDETRLGWFEELDRTGDPRPVPAPAPRPPVDMRPRRLSVTQIETWIRDPYAIFARHILGLQPLDPLDADPTAAERGILVHGALEKFAKAHGRELPERALDDLLEIGRELFARLDDRPGIAAFWWPRFVRLADWFVEVERKRRIEGIRVLAIEAKGEMTIPGPAGPFRLNGRADRFDRLPTGEVAIVDYKTGQAPSKPQVTSGLVPQLSLEAAMVGAGAFEGVAPAAVAELIYLRLTGGRIPGETRVIDEDVATVAADALAGLTRRIARFDDPKTPYLSRPRPQFARAYGDYDHLARVKEWSTGGGEE